MILERIRHWARQTPDAMAIEAWSHPISYRLFFQLIQSTRRFLETQGLAPNSVCALWAADILDQWVISLAARSLGISVITLPSGDLGTLGLLKGTAALLLPQADFARIAAQHMPSQMRRIMVPTAIYSAPILNQTDFELPKTPAGDHFCLSSGSTGAPKLIRFKAKNEIEYASICKSVPKSQKLRVGLHNYPIFGSLAYKWGISIFHDGCAMILDQGANSFMSTLRPDLTLTSLRPEHVRKILDNKIETKPRQDLTLLLGGGQVPFNQVMSLLEKITPNVVNSIGASELSTVMTYTHIRTQDDLEWSRLLPGRKVQIVDAQDNVLPAGQEGTLRVQLHRLDAHEYEGDTATSQSVFRDGFFYTGDLGILSPKGLLKLTGRVGDALNIGGIKLSTTWIEESLSLQTGARFCLFTGLASNNDNILHVVIERQTPLSSSEESSVREKLPQVNSIQFHYMNEFPINLGGKINRPAIRMNICGF